MHKKSKTIARAGFTPDEFLKALKRSSMSLPVELRAQLIDKLLKSLNPSQAEIDKLWALEAEKRVADIEAGKVQLIPGEEVFERIRKRLNQ